ncbi:MAG: hypothetical protein ETSY1_19450, partial [Candidatus Entotheonella factor]
MTNFLKTLNQGIFFKPARIGMVLVVLLGVSLREDKSRAQEEDTLSFFHTEGRDIVSDTTGENFVFRGFNLNGLEFGTLFNRDPSSLSGYPGIEGTDYFKPRLEEPNDLADIKSLGFNVVRVPFEWARLIPGWQPGDPFPPLESAYLGILNDIIEAAGRTGIYVILDMHDFLKYWSGLSSQVCVNDDVDYQALLRHTWTLLAEHFHENPAVLGYDIMNEPERGVPGACSSCNWHTIAQSVVNAIRSVDTNHLIFVEGPNFSLA